MSRSDDNLDNMFKDAFSGQEHQMDPVFWEGMKPMLQAPKAAWYLSKSFIAVSTVAVLTTSVILVSESTPENQNQTEISTLNQNELIESETNVLTSVNNSQNNTSTTPLNDLNSSNQELDNSSSNELIIDSKSELTNSELGQSESSAPQNLIINDFSAHSLSDNDVQNQSSTTNSLANQNNQFKQGSTTNNSSLNTIPAAALVSTEASVNNNSTALFTTPEQGRETPDNSRESTYSINENKLENQGFNGIGRMTSNPNFLLQVSDDDNSPQPINHNVLKPLNKPFSLRLSAGYLWSEPLNSPENGINSMASIQNIELSLEYHFKPHWGIQIGTNFNQITEEQSHSYLKVEDQSYYDYTDREVITNDSTWWLGGWFYYPPKQETVTDTTYVSKHDTGISKINAVQKMKVLEIPVLLTYNFSVHQFTVQIATGASVGIFMGTSGNYLNHGDPVTKLESTKSLFNSLQYNYLLRTELGYLLNDHWQLSATPQMKMNLNSMYKNQDLFNNKYLFYGINAGITYHF